MLTTFLRRIVSRFFLAPTIALVLLGASAAHAQPAITSATYDSAIGVLAVTGTDFLALSGPANDIAVNKLTVTGEGGMAYTLTSPDVEITSPTLFSVTVNATDKAALGMILNKNGTSSTGATTYNLAAAEDWAAGADAAVVVADLTGNGITVSNVPVPTITSATYDASTGVLSVTGTGLVTRAGAANDIDVDKLTVTGEGGFTRTLTSPDVDITSATSFSVTVNATDKAALGMILNKNGTASTGGTTYNLAAAEDWAAGADAAVVVADFTGNGITVSNVPVPTITSATYDAATGTLTVTGTGFVMRAGAANDIDVDKLTVTGDGGASHTLTSTSDAEIASGTQFTLTLSPADRAAVALLLNKDGTSSLTGTTYNLAAAEDWAVGADAAVAIADFTGNGITVSNGSAACFATRDDGVQVFASGGAFAVQAAVDRAAPGDTVKIAGTCVGTLNVAGTDQTVHIPKALTLQGGFAPTLAPASWTQPPDATTYPTVLDALAGGRVVLATAAVTLADLVIQNGLWTAAGNGGGIHAATNITLQSVTVRANSLPNVSGSNGGGGLYQQAGALTVSGSTFAQNSSSAFGGGFLTFGTLVMTDSVVVDNTSGNSGGGGVAVGTATVTGSTFGGNSAGGGSGGLYAQAGGVFTRTQFLANAGSGGGGGGLYLRTGNAEVRDCLFSGNTAAIPGTAISATTSGSVIVANTTIHAGASAGALPALDFNGGAASITNSILTQATVAIGQAGTATVTESFNLFFGNGADTSGTVTRGPGTLVGVDPLFVAPGTDFRLQPESPAIDAGDPAFTSAGSDLDGNPRVSNGRVDMGTYEAVHFIVTPSAGPSGLISPSAPQPVVSGASTSFTVTPDAGHTAAIGGTCGGTLVGNTYTTNPITASCTVVASFSQNTYSVTPSAGPNGSISPATPQTIAHGGTAIFTVTPDTGYAAAVGGTCGGVLVGNTYTTNPITSSCTVTATFTAAGVKTFTGPSATSPGNITASFTGGGAACTFVSAQFIPVAGHAASPPAGTAPANVDFPHGLFDFTLGGCTPGATITMTITYPTALPQNAWYWKYGPTASQPAPHWYVLGTGYSGASITFALTDGGLGDDDLAANGTIVDQGGPGTGTLGPVAVPTLSQWAMILLALLIVVAGMRRMRAA